MSGKKSSGANLQKKGTGGRKQTGSQTVGDDLAETQTDALFDDQALRNTTREGRIDLEDDRQQQVFVEAMKILNREDVPYAVGAAFARHAYTGIWRTTKDLDLFIRPQDLRPAFDALQAEGYRTEVVFPHWLAKAWKDGHFIDLIFGTGHGQVDVDEAWIERGRPGVVLGVATRLVNIEEMIASSLFVAERSRFDGAEFVHLVRSARGQIDWDRVLELIGEKHQELLLWMLVFFDIVYPGHSEYLPQSLIKQMFKKMEARWAEGDTPPRAFRGMILDPFSFQVDMEDWGYEDQRDLTSRVDQEGNQA